MARRSTVLATTAALALATAVTGTTGAQAASACPRGWGSTAEASAASSGGHLTGVRTGRHACFDRLVLDVAGPVSGSGYDVRYVPVVRADGSGARVPLRGAADLQVIVRVPSYDTESGHDTFCPADPREVAGTGGFRTFRQVAWAGSFEGQTTVGLGVRARLPFRVLVLPGPGRGSRLVVDVAHSW